MKNSNWQTQLAFFYYTKNIIDDWIASNYSKDKYWIKYQKALDIYLNSKNPDSNSNFGADREKLNQSYEIFQELYKEGDRHIGTSLALVRISIELGRKQDAVDHIAHMLTLMPWLNEPLPETLKINISRPFLAPIAQYEQVEIQISLAKWMQAAILDARTMLSGENAFELIKI